MYYIYFSRNLPKIQTILTRNSSYLFPFLFIGFTSFLLQLILFWAILIACFIGTSFQFWSFDLILIAILLSSHPSKSRRRSACTFFIAIWIGVKLKVLEILVSIVLTVDENPMVSKSWTFLIQPELAALCIIVRPSLP